jgi:hypothetical protein
MTITLWGFANFMAVWLSFGLLLNFWVRKYSDPPHSNPVYIVLLWPVLIVMAIFNREDEK